MIYNLFYSQVWKVRFVFVFFYFGQNDIATPEETPATKPIVGIIYPPPEVRNIVDKTASFVARLVVIFFFTLGFCLWCEFFFYEAKLSLRRNGPEFEARIRQNEINNPKFNFLNPNDPYHAYYRHKVNEFKEGKAQEPSAAVPKVMQQFQQLPQKVIQIDF